MSSTRQLAAILFVDVVGYTAIMGENEVLAFKILEHFKNTSSEVFKKHRGNLHKDLGDGTMWSFPSAVDAVKAGIEIQQIVNKSADYKLRIGIHLGDIILKGNDLFGDGVNISSRIQSICSPGSIYISHKIYDEIQNVMELNVISLGSHHLKNVRSPVRIYKILGDYQLKQDQILTKKPKKDELKSIVVIPFKNMSPDKDQEYFSDGLTDELITDLSQIKRLRVISSNSAMRLKESQKDIVNIASDLNVQYALEGSVRKSMNNVRITAKLVDTYTNTQLWADKYNGTLDDIFHIQEKVSSSIVESLKLKLQGNTIQPKEFEDKGAYAAYLQARYETWKFSESSMSRALRHIRKALEITGDHEILLATLGHIYTQMVQIGLKSDDGSDFIREATDCVHRIFNLNPDSGWGCYLQGEILFQTHLREAGKFLKEAHNLLPVNPDILIKLGYWYCLQGIEEKAEPLFEELIQIDPLTPINPAMPGFIQVLNGDFRAAVSHYQEFYSMDPDNPFAHWCMAWVHCWNREFDEAASILEHMEVKFPKSTFTTYCQLLVTAHKGNRELFDVALQMESIALNNELLSRELMHYFSLVGELDKGIQWLKNTVRIGNINYPFLSDSDWFLNNLKSDGRFQPIMEDVRQEWIEANQHQVP